MASSYFFLFFKIIFNEKLAELRTISLCDSDSDLFMQTYNEMHRKSSDSSHSGAAMSYYSGTESQQSVSERSFYDNVDHRQKNARNLSAHYLMPPMPPRNNNSNVNRSVSFQDHYVSGERKPRIINKNIVIKRRMIDERCSDCSSISRGGSSASKSNVDSSIKSCKSDVQSHSLVVPDNCSIDDKDNNGPFYVRVLRRMQKLSFFWIRKKRKKSNNNRGRDSNFSHFMH